MSLQRFFFVFLAGLIVQVTVFAVHHNDILYLNRSHDRIVADPEAFARHATEALGRPKLPRRHVETIAAVAGRLGRTELELTALERGLALDPAAGDLALRLGDALRRAQRFDDAARVYQDLLDTRSAEPSADTSPDRPDPSSIWLGLARVHRDAGDARAARAAFERVRAHRGLLEPERTEYFWVLAGLDPRAVLALGREILSRTPDAGDVRDQMITSALALGREDDVVDLARGGQRQSPGDAQWSRRLGESYLRQGLPEQAVTEYERALGARDAVTDDRIGLALALEAAGRPTESAEAWQRVPDDRRSARAEWDASRLRTLARGADPAVAVPELDAWLRAHPDDLEMRALLVELLAASGHPDLALARIDRLLEGPDRARWTAREIEIAWDAGARERALARLDDTTAGCDDRYFQYLDRTADPIRTERFLESVDRRGCPADSPWTLRAITLGVAAGRHGDALRLIDHIPAGTDERESLRSLEGQLRLWTGDAEGAAAVLDEVVRRQPDDRAARTALVDALRELGRPREAWTAAGPLTNGPALTTERLLMLADLALEADHPGTVASLLDRVPADAVPGATRDVLEGRALAALGRTSEAEALLDRVDRNALGPAGALVLIDSTVLMHGPDAALAQAAAFDDQTPAWRDVLARRVTIAALAGRRAEATQLRDVLAGLAGDDPTVLAVVDAETLLAGHRPDEALAVLSRLPEDRRSDRVEDLRLTALAGTGDLAGALRVANGLIERRPDFAPYRIRQADLAWRLEPTEARLARVLDLPSRFPSHDEARLTAARALAAAGRHGEALEVLGWRQGRASLPADGRRLAAESLMALGQPEEAVAILKTLAPDPTAPETPTAFLARAAVAGTAADRRAVLEQAILAFPDDVRILVPLARERRVAGTRDAALAAAASAVAAAPDNGDAWFLLVDLTAETRSRAELDRVLDRFGQRITASPRLALAMAEHVTGLAKTPEDAVLARALGWLSAVDAADGDGDLVTERTLARARLLGARERWTAAIEQLDGLVAREPAHRAARRLRAGMLSWAGRHDEAVTAYDVYLGLAPDDIAARRQQARVTGWAGRYAEAERRYAALRQAYPEHAAVAAEADAKSALFGERWLEAIDAYRRWLTLEPDDTEARFELSEVLRATGEVTAADGLLDTLISTTGHRLAVAARERSRLDRRPGVSVIDQRRDTAGYDDRRLLDLRQQGGAVRMATLGDGRLDLSAGGAFVEATGGDDARRTGRLGSVDATSRLSRNWSLEGRAAWWDFDGVDGALTGTVVATRRAGDTWTMTAGWERAWVLENLQTIDRRVLGSGPVLSVSHQSRDVSADVRASWRALSDGNRDARLSFTATRVLSQRLRGLRAIVWGEGLSFAQPAGDYFSPRRFARVDAGVEYTHRFGRLRFLNDRRRELSAAYLLGTDSRGVLYQHPSARLSIEVSNGVILDATASAIRSSVYRENAFTVQLRLGGPGGR